MTNDYLIPLSYDEWRHCIEVRCGIPLTESFVKERLAELQASDHAKTKEYLRIYGEDHLRRTVEWFRRAEGELAAGAGAS